MTNWPKPAALAVVPNDGKLLLVRRRNEPDAGLWGFPGGHVDPGETVLEAAVRELREETTIVADPVEYLINLDVIQRNDDGTLAHHFLLVAVLCRFRSGTPTGQDDVFEAAWFDFDTVLNHDLAMSKDVDTVLRVAMQRTEQAKSRLRNPIEHIPHDQ